MIEGFKPTRVRFSQTRVRGMKSMVGRSLTPIYRGWEQVTHAHDELFTNKRVVLFSLTQEHLLLRVVHISYQVLKSTTMLFAMQILE